ncbi:MAG: hypothetical protein K6E73_02365 [Bacteroidales bacterium]|nr:hypothetical protein [Bacteroidales bacterium]
MKINVMARVLLRKCPLFLFFPLKKSLISTLFPYKRSILANELAETCFFHYFCAAGKHGIVLKVLETSGQQVEAGHLGHIRFSVPKTQTTINAYD